MDVLFIIVQKVEFFYSYILSEEQVFGPPAQSVKTNDLLQRRFRWQMFFFFFFFCHPSCLWSISHLGKCFLIIQNEILGYCL